MEETVKINVVDYSKALTWYVNDKKFGTTLLTLSLYLLSCILIIPIFYVGPFLTGYVIKIIRNIQDGKYEIPPLDGSYWQDGITLLIISIALSFVVGLAFGIIVFGGTIFASVISESSSMLSSLISITVHLVNFVSQMVISLLAPFLYFLAYAIYAKTGTTSSLMSVENYKTVWQQNTWGIVISYVIYIAVLSALSMVGFVACCVGILPAMVIGNFMMAGFVGQLGVEGVE